MIEITENKANEIRGFEYTPNVFCNPIQDINGTWFISEIEAKQLRIQGNYHETIQLPTIEII